MTEPLSSGDGDHLVAIHDHLRDELTRVRDLVDQVERGAIDVAAARSVVNTMTMRQNDWTLGAYCATYCRLVTMHHSVEDAYMFPRMSEAEPSLGPVVARLEREHHDVAATLEDLDRSLVELVGRPEAGAGGVRRALDALSAVLLAHLSYEEEQLVGPLNRLSIGI